MKACTHCGQPVDRGVRRDDFMMTEEAWTMAHPECLPPPEGYADLMPREPRFFGVLHLACAEARLGRQTVPEDFTHCLCHHNVDVGRGRVP